MQETLSVANLILEQVQHEFDTRHPKSSIGFIDFIINGQPQVKWMIRDSAITINYEVAFNPPNDNILFGPNNSISRDSVLSGYFLTNRDFKLSELPPYNPNSVVIPLTTKVLSLYTNLRENGGDAKDGFIKTINDADVKFESIRSLIHQYQQDNPVDNYIPQQPIANTEGLRDIAILDPHQETIKRSKVLDGALIIDGGPGTGKTTSLIQRIKFLTSHTILEVKNLSTEEQEVLFDPSQGKSWIFYSPNSLLKAYLKNAMSAEGLLADDTKVKTWQDQRAELLQHLGLVNGKMEPFASRIDDHAPYFQQNALAYNALTNLFTDYIAIHLKLKLLKTQDPEILNVLSISFPDKDDQMLISEMKRLASKIQEEAKTHLNSNSIKDWVEIYIHFKKRFGDDLALKQNKLNERLSPILNKIIKRVEQNPELMAFVSNQLGNNYQFKLKDLIINVGIAKVSDTQLSEAETDIYNRVRSQFEGDLSLVGVLASFISTFGEITKGPEINILDNIASYYKDFRLHFLSKNSGILTKYGEAKLKESSKFLYADEADFIYSFIFRICKLIFKSDQNHYYQSTHRQIKAYKRNIKGIVAIDEATDFSVWELAAMSGLAHPYFDSVTLSGDMMQRMSEKGIASWNEYVAINSNTEIKQLIMAYRQTETLVNIAIEIYSKQTGTSPKFMPYYRNIGSDAVPLFICTKDEKIKVEWLRERIIEVFSINDNMLPTTAVFVNTDKEAEILKELLVADGILGNIGLGIVACTNGQTLGSSHQVRIFNIQHIKGLEFEAAFFIDLDKVDGSALSAQYLYIGLSRARKYLGVTLREEWPQDLSYIENHFEAATWQTQDALA